MVKQIEGETNQLQLGLIDENGGNAFPHYCFGFCFSTSFRQSPLVTASLPFFLKFSHRTLTKIFLFFFVIEQLRPLDIQLPRVFRLIKN